MTLKCITTTLTLAACLLASAPAHARHHHRHGNHHRHHSTIAAACLGWFCPDSGPSSSLRQRSHHGAALADLGAIQPHPPGCPGRAFCGCGASVRIFGHSVRSLWLAAAWYRFPRSAPAPGTVAVRRHHVMVLEADMGGGIWRVYDANSGGHATRVHARSIAGYTIVSPRA